MRLWLAAALMLLGWLVGCVRLGFDEGGAPEAGPASEMGSPRALDHGVRLETGTVADRGPTDGWAADASPTDAFAAACASGKPSRIIASNMVVCTRVSPDQCSAASVCQSGWHLCTASEFLARGGASAPAPDLEHAWIAGCIRSNGGASYPPTDEVCKGCAPDVSLPHVPVAWVCGGGTVFGMESRNYVGLTTGRSCLRVGADLPQTAAYWQPFGANNVGRGAVCCAP